MSAKRFLVVDDDDLYLSSLCDWIRHSMPSADVRTASSATEARRLLNAEPCDVLVSDVVMETPDAGWRLGIDAKRRGIAVLLLSADARAPWIDDEVRDIALVQKTELTPSSLMDFITVLIATQ
jgi:DNA-binding NtrC family response regulator